MSSWFSHAVRLYLMPRPRSATLTKFGSTKAIKTIFFDETINYHGENLAPSKGFPRTATLKRQNGRLEILTEACIEFDFENKT